LVDTNVWLERILDQAKSAEVGDFLDRTPADHLFVTDFAFHSSGPLAVWSGYSDGRPLIR